MSAVHVASRLRYMEFEIASQLDAAKLVYNLFMIKYEPDRRRQPVKGLPVSRKAFHIAIALILLICVICPFIEPALGWDNNIFVSGHDGDSTLALVALLLELVLALAGVGVSLVFLRKLQVKGLVVKKRSTPTPEFVLPMVLPDLSPPIPLRI